MNRTPVVGISQSVQELERSIDKAAQNTLPVWIIGEAGTEKEDIARVLHFRSVFGAGPWVTLDVASYTSVAAFEQALFGERAGTQAAEDAIYSGKLAEANGGTLFLEGLETLALVAQQRLMRAVSTLRSSAGEGFSTRIVLAISKDVESLIAEQRLDATVNEWIGSQVIVVPPLRERKKDLPQLAEDYFNQCSRVFNHSVELLSPEIIAAFQAYDWPGNTFELRSLIERLILVKRSGKVELEDLPHRIVSAFIAKQGSGQGAVSIDWEFPQIVLPEQGIDLKTVVTQFENSLVDQALARTHGNKNRASELLQMNRTTLVEKLRKRGMIVPLAKKGEGNPGHDSNGFHE